MKRITALLLALAFAAVILLPVDVTVNKHSSQNTNIADGNGPIPPIPPCVFNESSSNLSV